MSKDTTLDGCNGYRGDYGESIFRKHCSREGAVPIQFLRRARLRSVHIIRCICDVERGAIDNGLIVQRYFSDDVTAPPRFYQSTQPIFFFVVFPVRYPNSLLKAPPGNEHGLLMTGVARTKTFVFHVLVFAGTISDSRRERRRLWQL